MQSYRDFRGIRKLARTSFPRIMEMMSEVFPIFYNVSGSDILRVACIEVGLPADRHSDFAVVGMPNRNGCNRLIVKMRWFKKEEEIFNACVCYLRDRKWSLLEEAQEKITQGLRENPDRKSAYRELQALLERVKRGEGWSWSFSH